MRGEERGEEKERGVPPPAVGGAMCALERSMNNLARALSSSDKAQDVRSAAEKEADKEYEPEW